MQFLKNLTLLLTLACVLSVSAFAGETAAPHCAPEPGQTSTPPCAAQSPTDDYAVPGETPTPPALPVVYVTDIAETMLWSLLLF